MSVMKDIFDGERRKITEQRDKENNEKNLRFQKDVLPVIDGILDEIKLGGDLTASYEMPENWNPRSNADIGVTVIVGDKDGTELGRAKMALSNAIPSLVTVDVPKSEGSGLRTFTLSSTAFALYNYEMQNYSRSDADGQMTPQQIKEGFASAARAIVKLAAQNSVDAAPQQQVKRVTGGALRV